MKKISVIIPVYNGEKYIERCIDSIINQTYKNIEIIVINDGSTDNTEKLLEKYESIVVVNKKNEGVSKARNVGFSKATGDYIYFCDADDWLEQNAFEVAMKKIGDYDLLRFGHYVVNKKEKIKKRNNDDALADVDIIFNDNESLLKYLISNQTEGHLWNYIFSSSIIKDKNILFDEKLFYQEDVIFLIWYCTQIKNVKVISDAFYNYFVNENSVTKNLKSSIKNLSSIGVIRQEILKILKDNNLIKFEGLMEQRFLNLQLSYILEYRQKLSKKEIVRAWKTISSANYSYYCEVEHKKISLKWKIFVKLLKNKRIHLLNLYVNIYILLKK